MEATVLILWLEALKVLYSLGDDFYTGEQEGKVERRVENVGWRREYIE